MKNAKICKIWYDDEDKSSFDYEGVHIRLDDLIFCENGMERMALCSAGGKYLLVKEIVNPRYSFCVEVLCGEIEI